MTAYSLIFTAAARGPAEQARTPGNDEVGPSPIRADFPDGEHGARQYVHAWRTWLKMLDDCRPTYAERVVAATVAADHFAIPLDIAVQLAGPRMAARFSALARIDPEIRDLLFGSLREASR